uniref:Uncharacterized protein n=1 Tax=Anguilla anguilla TaxID=7936 RepID=A0A0E9WKC6_ANGAN
MKKLILIFEGRRIKHFGDRDGAFMEIQYGIIPTENCYFN